MTLDEWAQFKAEVLVKPLLAGDALRHYNAILPSVTCIIAAYETFVAAQDLSRQRYSVWSDHCDAMDRRMAYDGGRETDLRIEEKLLAEYRSANESADKARDVVMAAVAELAGRKG